MGTYYGKMELLSLRLLYTGHQKESEKGADQKQHGAGQQRKSYNNIIYSGWSTIEKAAKDRLEWKSLVAALWASRRYGDDWNLLGRKS